MDKNMELILAEKYAGSTVIRSDERGIVLRNSSGGIEKVTNVQAHNYSVTAGERQKQQRNSDMAAKAKQMNRDENEINAMKKQDARDEISEQVQRARDRRDAENKLGSNYKV